jgi:biopolymer transport protein TolR
MAFHSFQGGQRGGGQASDDLSFSRPLSEINVTPLVDVMLVLLVIFIISAPLMASSIRLDLPQTPAARPSESPRALALVVDRLGVVHANDQALEREALLRLLQTTARAHADTEVQLKADAAVPYGRVVEIIGLAQQAGLNRVGFVADNPSPAPGH